MTTTWTRRTRACVAAGALLALACGEVKDSPVGSAGYSGSGGMPGASSGGADDTAGGTAGGGARAACVDVSHANVALQRDDLQAIGTGFDAYEGELIRIIATPGEPDYGFGQAPIKGGAFEILLPGVLGDYTEIGIYVDTVRDDACSPDGEVLWQLATGPASSRGPDFVENPQGVVVWEFTPEKLRTFEQAGACNINGNFDLTKPIPCSATHAL